MHPVHSRVVGQVEEAVEAGPHHILGTTGDVVGHGDVGPSGPACETFDQRGTGTIHTPELGSSRVSCGNVANEGLDSAKRRTPCHAEYVTPTPSPCHRSPVPLDILTELGLGVVQGDRWVSTVLAPSEIAKDPAWKVFLLWHEVGLLPAAGWEPAPEVGALDTGLGAPIFGDKDVVSRDDRIGGHLRFQGDEL